MKLSKLITLLFFVFSSFFAKAQKSYFLVDSINIETLSELDKTILDSILPLVKKAQHDTDKIKLVYYLTENTYGINVWPKYNQLMYNIAVRNIITKPKETFFYKYKGQALNNFGYYQNEIGKPEEALKYYISALEIAEKYKFNYLLLNCYNNIGVAYKKIGDFSQALKYYQLALKLGKETKNKKSYAVSLAHIAAIYWLKTDTLNAKTYYENSLELKHEIKDLEGIAKVNQELAELYYRIKNFDAAYKLITKAFEINKVIGFERGIAENYWLLGRVLEKRELNDSALYYFDLALKLNLKINNKAGEADVYNSLGSYYAKVDKDDLAADYVKKALDIYIAEKIQDHISFTATKLAEYNQKNGKYKEALYYFNIAKENDNKLKNQEFDNLLARQNLQSEFEQKEFLLQLEEEKKLAIAEEKESRKNVILFIVFGAFVVLFLMLLYLYKKFKFIKKQKRIIDDQQEELQKKNRDLDFKNKMVADSIQYAKHIVTAIMPNKKNIATSFSDYFIFFKPKDIVSGDFYWTHKTETGESIVIAADCTGHGVPGAMLSIICSSIIEKIVVFDKIIEPSLILKKFYMELSSKIHADPDHKSNDGVEMSVASYNSASNVLKCAASYHKMYYIFDNRVNEYLGDRIQVRKGLDISDKTFSEFVITPQKGATFYMFTDGFVDQKGGLSNKKYFYTPFKEFLVKIYQEPAAKQQKMLNDEIVEWYKNVGQYDDILVVGLKF
ncbi:MAG: tetratricopeptide repeat protein [Bacteroidota bacterium]